MEQTTLKIALAALMHDLGKFAQGCLEVTPQYRNDHADQYQPFYNGRHSHIHAIYTAAFIEQMQSLLPPELNSPGWGEGDSFINLAAGHHKPETPLQWLVAQADRISSGLDRAVFEQGESIAYKEYKRTRLLPILEGLGPDRMDNYRRREDFQWRYRLAPLSPVTLFPLREGERPVAASPEEEYRKLFNDFVEQLAGLLHGRDNIGLWAQHFDSLLLDYTAFIPAARVGEVVHDVSLYDHARTTSAFAAALHRYHQEQGDLQEASIRDGSAEKFLLVTGDFYGIQDFIFSAGGETGKNRSKLLRGRSFSVSLFSELAADMVCEQLGLPFLSVVLNAAGKFTLVAPNTGTARRSIAEVEQEINDWLFAVSYGQASMGFAVTPARPDDFHSNRFAALWNDRHLLHCEERKRQKLDYDRYGGVVADYLDAFRNDLSSPLCPLCGKRPSVPGAGREGTSRCAVCRDHVMLGEQLVKRPRLAVVKKGVDLPRERSLLSPLFDRYQLLFTGEDHQDLAARGDLLRLWTFAGRSAQTVAAGVTRRRINGYVPVYRKEDEHDTRLLEGDRSETKKLELIEDIREHTPKTFTHIACKARIVDADTGACRGTEAIAVLKADIDNLGLLIGCGLPEERFTLSRLATLSRQLDGFFTEYIPALLAGSEEFNDVYTVFAGGDDLFLIGPWNRMAYLARHLRERFDEYVCQNDAITFSAGITLHKTHVPVDKMAAGAEAALEAAKGYEGKNAVTMFGCTVSWPEFAALLDNRAAMQGWLDDRHLTSSMMYRFNRFIDMAGREKLVREQETIHVEDLECLKWRAMFAYSLNRNLNRALRDQERTRALQEIGVLAGWLEQYGSALRVPLWHLLYDQR